MPEIGSHTLWNCAYNGAIYSGYPYESFWIAMAAYNTILNKM